MKPLENRGNHKGKLASPNTLLCVHHLLHHGPCTLVQLESSIGPACGWQALKDARTRLVGMLHKLRQAGHVHRVLRDDVIFWVHGPAPEAALAQAHGRKSAPVVMPVASAPQYDCMHGPLYVPDAEPVLRPGALDYKACASAGQRC
jgi:hypothetical protein